MPNLSPNRVRLAYAISLGAYAAAERHDDLGRNETPEARRANLAYRTAQHWLMDRDLPHWSVPWSGDYDITDIIAPTRPTIGDTLRKHPEIGALIARVQARFAEAAR